MASHSASTDIQLEHTLTGHLSWVYGAAKRRVREPSLTDDVVQAVFILYWQKRPVFTHEPQLIAWLYKAVRYCAANALRIERTRAMREREVAMVRPEDSGETQAHWSEIAEELETAMDHLRSRDRDIILLRFYRSHTLAEVGRLLGITEEAARKRIDRAIDQLRLRLAGRGIAAASTTLPTLLLTNLTPEVPVKLLGLASSAAATSAKSTAVTLVAKHANLMMWLAKAKLAAGVAIAATTLVGVTAVAVLPATTAPKPATQQTASAPAATDEYYVGGQVPRVGVYSLNNRTVTLNQALASAGLDLAQNQNMIVELVRRETNDANESAFVSAISQLRGKMDLPLNSNDVLTVRPPRPADSPIAPVDHLRITIVDLIAPNVPTSLMKYTDREGRVHLPLIPAVPLNGLSCGDAAKEIAKAYHDHYVIRDANVSAVRADIIGAWFPLGPIQPGESLLVRINDLLAPNVESALNLTVSAAGDLDLPLIKPVKVAGMKDYEAEQAIVTAYRAAKIIQNAQVTVERPARPVPADEPPKPSADPKSRDAFIILGRVPQPGQYPLKWQGQTQPTNIKVALELAHLDPQSARSQVVMTIRQPGQFLSFHTVGDLLDNPDLDLPLQSRDLLLVGDDGTAKPEPADHYYVTGVARSGAYGATQTVSFRQALISAGYRPEDGDYLARINRKGGVSVMTIAEILKCDARWLDVSPGDILCVCRDQHAMIPPPPTTNP